MAKTLRVRTRAGWVTKPAPDLPENRLSAEEVDDNFLEMEDGFEAAATAAGTSFDNTASGLTATDAQAAIDEVEGRVDSVETGKVAKSGDTMTGALTLPANGLTVGTDQLVATGGNVGIGTTSPTFNLDVSGGAGNGIRYLNTANSIGAVLGASAASAQIGSLSSHPVEFLVGSVERMRIDSAGRVGIGTSSPNHTFHVASGAVYATSTSVPINGQIPAIQMGYDTSADMGVVNTWNSKPLRLDAFNDIIIRTMGTDRMRIDSAGRVTMPFQPAFKAMSSLSGSSASAQLSTAIRYNLLLFDRGGNYNTSTYRFTAPVAGTYFIGFSLAWNTLGFSVGVRRSMQIRVNGSRVEYIDFAPNGDWDLVEHATLVYLSANDFVDVAPMNVQPNDVYWNGAGSNGVGSFRGFLVG